MIVVISSYGLGNQMSQYSFFNKMPMTNKKFTYYKPQHNGYELDKLFGIKKDNGFLSKFAIMIYRMSISNYRIAKLISELFCKISNTKIVIEKSDYNFIEFDFQENCNYIFFGGWHHSKYHDLEVIRNIYRFNLDYIDEGNKELLQLIEESNSIGVHVRAGDYLLAKNLKEYGNIANMDYYQRSIEKIMDKDKEKLLFIFTDNKRWVEDNFKIPHKHLIISNPAEKAWIDMYLLMKTKSKILSNSTFSLWAGFLSDSENVICPERYTNYDGVDKIYPKKWSKVS